MNNLVRYAVAILLVASQPVAAILHAQACQTKADADNLPGKYVDELKPRDNRTIAQLVALERASRANFTLTGATMKASASSEPAHFIGGKISLATADMNIGIYEYFCNHGQLRVNDEYSNVIRAYVNRFHDIEPAFSNFGKSESFFYAVPGKYDSRWIALHDFIRFPDKRIFQAISAGKGYFQDVPDEKVKQGTREYMTRHWYITRPGAPIFVPVTRKEYLEALLEYYDREKLDTANSINEEEQQYAGMIRGVTDPARLENAKHWRTARMAHYSNWQEKIEAKKAIVSNALKQNTPEWLAMPASVNPNPMNITIRNTFGPGSNDYASIDVNGADTRADAEKTGWYTFSGFWDAKGGDTLYKYNPTYFVGSTAAPAKPQMIELTFRYVKIPVGQKLVENFTTNFDFEAARKLLN